MVPVEIMTVAIRRLHPLVQRYWMSQEKMTAEQLAANAYLQAVTDMVDAHIVPDRKPNGTPP